MPVVTGLPGTLGMTLVMQRDSGMANEGIADALAASGRFRSNPPLWSWNPEAVHTPGLALP